VSSLLQLPKPCSQSDLCRERFYSDGSTRSGSGQFDLTLFFCSSLTNRLKGSIHAEWQRFEPVVSSLVLAVCFSMDFLMNQDRNRLFDSLLCSQPSKHLYDGVLLNLPRLFGHE